MASSNLQGLNLVHPESPPSNLSDAQDLLSTPLFPDLAAHLDLWTNVNFASDEPFVSARDRELKESETEVPHADSLTRKEVAHSFTTPAPSPVLADALPQSHQFDFQRFLAEFGIPPPNPGGLNFSSNSFGAVPPPPVPQSTIQPAQSEVTPAAKRARTSKTTPLSTSTSSSSSSSSPTTSAALPEPSEAELDTSTPLTAAEDKRRRNTAASARFRLKKKEREAALDAKAHALEERVASLERECEGLRRENGWLRGLVVGVTGGVVPNMSDVPISAPSSSAPNATATATTATGAEKRKRDEESA